MTSIARELKPVWRKALGYESSPHVVSYLEAAALDSIRQWGDAVLTGARPQYWLSWDREVDRWDAPFWTMDARTLRLLERRGLVVMVDDYGRAMAV